MKFTKIKFEKVLIILAIFVVGASSLVFIKPTSAAQFFGAIFTTLGDGQTVNQNLYTNKADVYLNGGPQNINANGLPVGTYYFQVTDPSGATLLSTDNAVCRQVEVALGAGGTGIISGASLASPAICRHADGTQNTNNGGSIPVQLIPFNDTPNNGGEYKVWLIRKINSTIDPIDPKVLHFSNSNVKTDNFKVNAATPPVSLSGHKFYDTDEDGVFDPTESPIPGWKISLCDSNGNEVDMTLTDSDGFYEFLVDQNSGEYMIKEELRSADNWQAVTDAQRTVNSLTDHTDIDFGNIRRAKLSGLKFRDANMNGTRDIGEGIIGGIEIRISTVEPTGDPLNPVVESVSTNAVTGEWMSGLHPIGTTYTVCENVSAAQYLQTAPASGCYSGTLAFSINDNSTPGDNSDDFTDFFEAVDVGNLNFGNIGLVSISGTKYKDADMSGTFTTGDSGVSGVTINVTYTRPNNTTGTAQATTGTGGAWSVTGIPEGSTFEACEVVPTGSIATAAICRTGTAGDTGVNFFNIPVFRIGGVKYYDADLNGVFSGGDTTLAGIKITVTATLPNGVSDGEMTFTGAGGIWISKLYPEGTTYTVTETLPLGSWTNPASRNLTGTVNGSNNSADFLNVCSATPGGHTLGFWSNKNGLSYLQNSDFTRLTGYNLRNADGSNRDFIASLTSNKSALSSWLLSANASNMAYMLSAQMTATDLSVVYGFTTSGVVVDGTRNVAAEIVYGNSLLANPIAGGAFINQNGSVTVKAGALRTEQTRVKDIFDRINNGGSFQQSVPCSVNY